MIDDRQRAQRKKMIDRLRPPAQLTPGTGPGGIPMANAASTFPGDPDAGDEDLQDAHMYGQEAGGETPQEDAEAEQQALEEAAAETKRTGVARFPRKKRKPTPEEQELDVDDMVPMG